MLEGKRIVLGISGGIAAYKCTFLVRLLVKEGAEVRVILTKSAADFVTPQTLSVLSKNQVLVDFFDTNYNWNNHVKLAEWADVLLIAPLTANTLAKMATGLCDNLLLATYLSAKAKTIVAPAMDLDMYKHPSVKQNLETLESFGNSIIPPETGELASGLHGEGRMAEPEDIVTYLKKFFSGNLPLNGKKVLINAGPTYEAIDPVRFIGNRSSGKMGLAIAEIVASRGAEVTLVLGPNQLNVINKAVKVISVESSDQMFDVMLSHYANQDIVICSAAVADYKPAQVSNIKIKKKDSGINLELIKTQDILKELGKRKTTQFLVGFALETNNIVEYAQQKLKEKNLDLIIANSAAEKGIGIGADSNKIVIIDKHNKISNLELKHKLDVAADIIDYITLAIK